MEVSITHKQYVTVTCDGAAVSVLTDEGETVSDVLGQLNIKLGKNDLISEDLNTQVSSGDSIVINRVKITYKKKTKQIPYSSKRVASLEMARGTEAVTQKGVKGKTVYTYELKSIDGGKPTATLVNTKTKEPVTQVTSYGTAFPHRLSALSASLAITLPISTTKKGPSQRFPATLIRSRRSWPALQLLIRLMPAV